MSPSLHRMSPPTKHFVRHYVEMVVAMFAGMAVLWVPADRLLAAAGTSPDASPTVMFLTMAVTMTVPMVGWMMYRGHGRRANAEMAASMLLPTFAVIGAVRAGLVEDTGLLMAVEHVAMLASMLGAMLLRPAEYRSHAHARSAPAEKRVTA
jgi:hypothetical protein